MASRFVTTVLNLSFLGANEEAALRVAPHLDDRLLQMAC